MTDGLILVCREGFEQALREEVLSRTGLQGSGEARLAMPRAGLVEVQGAAAHAVRRFGVRRLAFARQWLERAGWVSGAPGASPLPAAELIAPLAATQRAWTLHAFGATAEGEDSLTAPAVAAQEAILTCARAEAPAVAARYVEPRRARDPEALALQLCVTPTGAWHSLMRLRELLDPYPGGVHRKPFDPLAPSRSYLKIEEAFDVLGEEPRPGQRAVDLGASPGGWTYAFLKRGCRVIAVDRGPLRLQGDFRDDRGVEHVLRDGLSYAPPRPWVPVDWLASDMLQPPGRVLGMLRRWFDGRWMRRFVVNVKIPQDHPWTALAPLAEFLEGQRGLEFRVRQLYHDRREVTVVGTLRSGRG
jgi:23S rRNA (cytidine2498-2'-O)-methyltransferase